MYNRPENSEFCFSPNLIGDALAYIVSEIEGESYIYDSLKVYRHGWMQGRGIYIDIFNAKAIVRQGFSKCSFCLDSNSPWILAKLAHILECTMHWTSETIDYERPISFVNEFRSQDCAFPYLIDFLNILENAKKSNVELTKEMVMELASDFVIKQDKGDVKKLVVKKDNN